MRFLGIALILVWGCDDAGPSADPMLQLVDAAAEPDAAVDAMIVDAAIDAAPPDMAADAAPLFTVDCDDIPETTVEEFDLGDVNIGTGGTLAQRFTLPEGAFAFTIVMIEAEDASLMAVTHLTDPEGRALVSPMPDGYRPSARDQFLGPFPGGFYSPNRSSASASGASALLVPNNPSVAAMPGEWQARFAAVSMFTGRPVATTARIKVLVKRAARPPTCGRLPLHLFFTGSHGWTADSAPDDPGFQRALARMQDSYARVGVTLDPITYDDVPDPPDSVEATGGPGSDMHQLFATNGYGDGVALFFVARITSPFGGGVGGVAGGVPGPTLEANTPRSGVVVATELDPNPEAIGHIMGHESGHFLGLFHTIEFIGETDQIEDTPTRRDDTSNLMYPTVTPDEAHFSPGQGWVLHKNASVIAEVP